MKLPLKPAKKIGGTLRVPGDKSIGHRSALLSIIARNPVTVVNFPDGADCQTSLSIARQLGVTVEKIDSKLLLTPPSTLSVEAETILDCGNSGTTARLLAGLLAGSKCSAILSGDESLSSRPMKRIVAPLTAMGAELFDTDGHLPLKVRGASLLPFEYRLPVASAQVKSAILLAGLSSGCSVTLYEDFLTRDHTERMIAALGGEIEVEDTKAVMLEDPNDPRKKKMIHPHDYKRRIHLKPHSTIEAGTIDIPGDISTAAYFFALAAISGKAVTVEGVGLNPTRTEFLDYLKAIGCAVTIDKKSTVSGEHRGDVTVIGGELKGKKISGEMTVGLIDEIPIVAVIAACAEGTTIIRDAGELKVKESDRLAAIAENLRSMGVKVGLLEDGLAIEGSNELHGADINSYNDHRIVMAFSIAAMVAVGPSVIDDSSVVAISCPTFYDLLAKVAR
ncbi:MAG: 3-phosphoshikimate 1-carboxyvinyltransferase [candidate division Zixibacteria bacterium]|mgnify:CR=1 FL=1|nr:3-phosphoshikimate 1-carboxyvinyltransferase [candidate division Zixibacteria bacterium]